MKISEIKVGQIYNDNENNGYKIIEITKENVVFEYCEYPFDCLPERIIKTHKAFERMSLLYNLK